MTRVTCPSCGSRRVEPFYELGDVPVNSVLLVESRKEAVSFPRGVIVLAFCRDCGFIYNSAFDGERLEYSTRYEETQGYSPTFHAWHTKLAQRLVGRYGLRNKTVLEIGCGKGEFLTALCEMGDNRGIGFDPAYVPERNHSPAAARIEFVPEFFSERFADRHADFVACKMTLEHVAATGEFVQMVRRAVGDDEKTVVFFQVPDVHRILAEMAFWDVYYEHCSYFSLGSIARLFRRSGFNVFDLAREYDDQYLVVDARPRNGKIVPPLAAESDMAQLSELVRRFSGGVPRAVSEWRLRIGNLVGRGGKVVLWGSGSKGVAFLTTLRVRHGLEYVVDVNPHRQGHFMPGSGQRIVSPDFLTGYRPTAVIVMNPVYVPEIAAELRARDLHPEVLIP